MGSILYLDWCMPKQTVQNILTKVLLNQIVLGPCVIAVVFAWNNLWQGKLSELSKKYQKDTLPTLFIGDTYVYCYICTFGRGGKIRRSSAKKLTNILVARQGLQTRNPLHDLPW